MGFLCGLKNVFGSSSSDASAASPVDAAPTTASMSNASRAVNNSCDDDEGPIPIERRIKTLTLGPSGLYAHEILLLSYAEKFTVSQDEFQGFWWHRYGISDVSSLLASLKSRGYLVLGGLPASLRNAKVVELSAACKKLGIPSSGKKADLIQRLLGSGKEDFLGSFFPLRYLELTDSGRRALELEPYIPFAHSHSDLATLSGDYDIWSIGKLFPHGASSDWKMLLVNSLDLTARAHYCSCYYGFWRNSIFEASEILAEDGQTENAFQLFAKVICVDLSLIFNTTLDDVETNISFYTNFCTDSVAPYDVSSVRLTPGIVKRLVRYSSSLNLDDEGLARAIACAYEITEVPIPVFTADECAAIAVGEVHQITGALPSLYEHAQRRLLSPSRLRN